MTDFHYFEQPSDTSSGTLNPVYELLDFPIVMGQADDIVLTGPAPEAPLVDGRKVTDPRLVKALSKPITLDRAEVLDRSAKLGGILRAMGLVDRDGETIAIAIAEDVPPIARTLSILAAIRIGVNVDLRSAGAEQSQKQVTAVIHTIDAAPIDSGRASVKVIRSRFEGVGITVAGETANLDQAMRDSRVESAEVAALSPGHPLILTEDGHLDARASLAWLSREALPEA